MNEPTAWINKERDVITFDNLFPEMTPLYEKREWVGLTDDEIYDSYNEPRSDAEMVAFARAIETKLKEKNG
jgi:hypothetical protein